ncbi:hypothetical protein FGG08_004920 [Glutinoglossum americanum]|uniref:DDHD domain-containing protein n=1 Tax=Glutinoglossum americanum TaxID=1670608 RepID=A0A9P8L1Y6_9PEZI|nr:hypothetical protein FGG08_004920 [Glutinoglossum americanum]
MAVPEKKSYLLPGLPSPWQSGPNSRSSTPRPSQSGNEAAADGQLGMQQGGDHTVSHRHWLSLKKYPPDCPSLNARWFYAIDVPKRKPNQTPKPDDKPPPAPKKFVAFSPHDSRSIEVAFQKLVDEDGAEQASILQESEVDGSTTQGNGRHRNTSINAQDRDNEGGKVKVPVNEDYLFDVDIERRELGPVYWLGPVYDVKRGTWFYQEGSTLRPCEENLAAQLEEGYLKVKPFRYENRQPTAGQPKPRPTSLKPEDTLKPPTGEDPEEVLIPSGPAENPKVPLPSSSTGGESPSPQQAQQMQTYRLFGSYMNSIVTYQDATTAWLLTDDFFTQMSSTVYQRLAGGGYLSGVKIVRGYSEPGRPKELKTDGEKRPDTAAGPTEKDALDSSRSLKAENAYKRRSAPPSTTAAESLEPPLDTLGSENRRQRLERDMSSLVSPSSTQEPQQQEEEARKRDEKEMEDDYRDDHGEEQGREVEHLLLVTHGIGQRLGLRLESVNFIHDVNVLRKTLKSVYTASADLQALDSEMDKLPKNCRVQVLPVSWRHLLDFPKQSIKQNRKEHDLGDADGGEEEEYPSLADITIEGVPAVRSLIADLALDILLYQSAYREHISGIVVRESNRIYKLFCERNPSFKGRVSLVGHSLGSAVLFDILCRQKGDERVAHSPIDNRRKYYHNRPGIAAPEGKELRFDFPVESLFCLGSPIGLFQMLKGRTIAARQMPDALPSESPFDPDPMEDPFLTASNTSWGATGSIPSPTQLPYTVSSPKCEQLFNIFHPTDPISYRIEPLISPAMTSLKPQPLPYTKKGIFDAPMGQGFSSIGSRVGQSMSGLWTSLSSGIASSILNRSLGFTGDELTAQSSQTTQIKASMSVGAGTNISGGGVIPSTPLIDASAALGDQKRLQTVGDMLTPDELGQHMPTHVGSEFETLYAGYEKKQKGHQSDEGRDLGVSAQWEEVEERGRRLRREEAKVRALNSTGRVDFSIQEWVCTFSFMYASYGTDN